MILLTYPVEKDLSGKFSGNTPYKGTYSHKETKVGRKWTRTWTQTWTRKHGY
jgi:hypothetical protein